MSTCLLNIVTPAMALALVFCTGWETPVIAGEPNHLVPVPAYDRSGYNEAVFESFLGGKSAQAWMIAQPSFAPEYAVLLRHIQTFAKNSPPFNPKVESDKWVVEHLEVRSKIWKWKELPGGGSDLDIKVTKDFFQSATEVPEDFAEKVMAAWSGVLRQTRYVETDGLGQDGEIFQFFCSYNLFGQTWSPTTGIPRKIADMGLELCALAKGGEKEKGAHMRKCMELAKELNGTKSLQPAR